MKFKVLIANKIIEIDCMYEQTLLLCETYSVNEIGEADFTICIENRDIEEERRISGSDEEFSDMYLEQLSVCRKLAEKMIEYNTFLMHGAAVSIKGKGCLITAPSGTGKTTLAKQLLDIAEGAVVVNGDKPLISIDQEKNKVFMCGTPWSGKEHMNENCVAPLDAIFFLERGNEDGIKELDMLDVWGKLLSQTYRPKKMELYLKTLSLLGMMKGKVKFYQLKMRYAEKEEYLDKIAANMVIDAINA